MSALTRLFARIEQCYENGRPLYLQKDEQMPPSTESVFKIIRQADFHKMKHSDVQLLLRRQHIVVTGIPHEEQGFEEALLSIAPLDLVASIQGRLLLFCFTIAVD